MFHAQSDPSAATTAMRHGHPARDTAARAFTLVEMLVVIAIISILMTIGSVGLSSLGGKGVTSGVATAEALFDEARSTAIGKNLRTCVLVAKSITNSPGDDLRRILLATEEIETDKNKPNFGQAKDPDNPNPTWEISSRGTLLPEQTFFSTDFSKKDHTGGGGSLDTVTLSNVKKNYQGDYFIYRFNAQGVCETPGASFIIGAGARVMSKPADTSKPRTTGGAKRDFGGFIVWRNGRTTVFRSPDQIGIPASVSTF